MAANKEISDDWGWFPQLSGSALSSDEIIVVREREVFRASASSVGGASANIGTNGFWEDATHTQASPQVITASTRTLFTVDGLGANTVTSDLGENDAGVFASNAITPNAVGDTFTMRIGVTVVPQSVSTGEYVEVQLDIGSGSQINILTDRIDLAKGIGVPHAVTLSFPIFCRETFNLNGGRVYITPSIDVNVHSKTIFLQRTYEP